MRQVYFFSVFSIPYTAEPHEHSKPAGTQQITHRLADTQGRFRESGSPLRHRQLRCPGAYHEDNKQPEDFCLQQLSDSHAFAFADDGNNGAGGKIENIIQRDDSPDAGQNTPVFRAEDKEKAVEPRIVPTAPQQ